MTAKLYFIGTGSSLKKVRNYLQENNMNHVSQNLKDTPLQWEQLLEILMYTENGIEDILAYKSMEYAELLAQGIDFDDLTLTQFHELVVNKPKLLRSPITVIKNNTFVGYTSEDMTVLHSRESRKAGYNEILKTLQLNDTVDMVNEVFAY